MALDRSAPRTRPEDLPAGPRRLKRLIMGRTVYYPSRAHARRAWVDVCAKSMATSEEHAQASVKVTYEETEQGWKITGRVHPAKFHWTRVLEHIGAIWEMGTSTEQWYRIPPRTEEELMRIHLNKSNLGRYWP